MYSRKMCAARVRDGRRRARCASSACWRFISIRLTPLCIWLHTFSAFTCCADAACVLPACAAGRRRAWCASSISLALRLISPLWVMCFSKYCFILSYADASSVLSARAAGVAEHGARLYACCLSFSHEACSSVLDFAKAPLLTYSRNLCAARLGVAEQGAHLHAFWHFGASFLCGSVGCVFGSPLFSLTICPDAGCVLPACARGVAEHGAHFQARRPCISLWLTALCVPLHAGLCSHMLTQVVCCPHALRCRRAWYASPSLLALASPSLPALLYARPQYVFDLALHF